MDVDATRSPVTPDASRRWRRALPAAVARASGVLAEACAEGRRPEYHVALFDREALVESLDRPGVILEARSPDPAGGPGSGLINFITGPNRIADIELTLASDMRGPRELHVIFLQRG